MSVRRAVPGDVEAMHGLVHALALYEKEPDAVVATTADLADALFGDAPVLHAHVVEVDGTVVGTALWWRTYSTWTGRHGIWLEDLFVLPEHRGAGWGRALLATLAAECVRNGWTRLEWTVLDWNEPALGFYRSVGARGMDEWTTQRLDGDALTRLGSTTARAARTAQEDR